MKTASVSEDQLWGLRCLNMSRLYAALSIVGLLVLFQFIVVGLVSSPLLYWRTAAQSLSFTIVEHCFYLGMILTYLSVAISVMFAAPDFRQHNYAFLHGTLIGFSYPFALFMLGESAAWWTVPSPTLAGVSVLSAIMGGIVFCGSFIFWILFSQPSGRKIVDTEWPPTKGMRYLELSIIILWHLAILGAVISMLWSIVAVQSQQGFALVINCVAYLSVMVYTYMVRYQPNMNTHLALGTLFGATLALLFMSGKWTFNFASRYLGTGGPGQESLYISALSFNAGIAALALPLLALWPCIEAKSSTKDREGEY